MNEKTNNVRLNGILTFAGSLFRHLSTNSRNSLLKFPSSWGGSFFGIKNSTFIGCRSELGGSPLASSMAVIPRLQISACQHQQKHALKNYTLWDVLYGFVYNLLLFPTVKEFWKSVTFWQSYHHQLGGPLLFGKQCRISKTLSVPTFIGPLCTCRPQQFVPHTGGSKGSSGHALQNVQ